MIIITVLKGVKATISKNMLNWVYGALIVNDGTIYRYYIVQQKSEMYTLQEDVYISEYDPLLKKYTVVIIYGATFLNLIPTSKYRYTPMAKEDDDVTLGLKQIIIRDLNMIKMYE